MQSPTTQLHGLQPALEALRQLAGARAVRFTDDADLDVVVGVPPPAEAPLDWRGASGRLAIWPDRGRPLGPDDAAAIGLLVEGARRRAAIERELAEVHARRRAVIAELQRGIRERAGPLFVGASDAIRKLDARIDLVAGVDEPVLLVGVQGQGRGAAAFAIHERSARRGEPFLDFDLCAWAHRGAHAHELTQRLDLARDGTVLLDDVDLLSGEHSDRAWEVLAARPGARLLASAATTAPRMGSGHPLWQRLSWHVLNLPCIDERRADIPAMASALIRHVHSGERPPELDGDSLKALMEYSWPGQFYELARVLQRALAEHRGGPLVVAPELLDDAVMIGRHRLRERLGHGGMGEVWRGEHVLLRRPAAIKVIRRPPDADDAQVQQLHARLAREARSTARLTSPHTVRIFDFGSDDDGAFYIVMELLEGRDLAWLVDTHGPLVQARVVHVLQQACRSLIEAHGHGLVHRDIKPANLLLCRMGAEHDVVKLLDFGLVKRLDDEATLQLTADGAITGTPAFMAPEMATGADVDGRADLYALGCVGWYLLTGALPFGERAPMQMLMAHVAIQPQTPSSATEQAVDPALDALILRCMAKAPEDRPPTAEALWRDLAKIPLASDWTAARAERWWEQHRVR